MTALTTGDGDDTALPRGDDATLPCGDDATLPDVEDVTLPATATLPMSSRPGGGLDRAPLIGTRYEILGFLGKGGMGSVYRVRDLELDEVVAQFPLLEEHFAGLLRERHPQAMEGRALLDCMADEPARERPSPGG